MSKFLYIELQVRQEAAEIIANNFSEVKHIFDLAAKNQEYDGVALTLTAFVASTESAIIKVSDPYLHSWTYSMKKAIRIAWANTASLLRNEEFRVGLPTLLFSTSIPE